MGPDDFDIEFEEGLDEELEEIEDAVDDLEDAVDDVQDSIEELTDTMADALRIQMMLANATNKTTDAFEDLEDAVDNINDQLDDIVDSADDLEDAFEDLDDALGDYVDSVDDAVDSTDELEDSLGELEETVDDADDAFEGLDEELDNYVDLTDDAVDSTDKLGRKVKDTGDKVKATDKELERSVKILEELVKLADKLNSGQGIVITTTNAKNRNTPDNSDRLTDKANKAQAQLDAQYKKMIESAEKTVSDLFIRMPSNASFKDVFKTATRDIISLTTQVNKYNKLKNKNTPNTDNASADAALADAAADSAKAVGITSGQLLKLVSTATKAAAAISLVVTALIAVEKISASAHDTTLTVEQSLRKMDSSLGDVGNNAIKASNNFTIAKNRMSDLGQAISSLIEPVYNLLGIISKGITDLMNIGREYKAVGDVGGHLLNYANYFNKRGLETPVSTSMPTMVSIAGSAEQAGFDKMSAANLGAGTYQQAIKLAMQYREEDVDALANRLADAWIKGSDAAKNYGIVVNDEVLAGWAAQEKNIDIVNVKLSDARMQALRYELAMIQASHSGESGIQDQIKAWKQYGMQLKATQNQLLSFEHVITLQGLDTEIPDIKAPDMDLEELENTIDTEGPVDIPISPILDPGNRIGPIDIHINPILPGPIDILVNTPGLKPLQYLLELLAEIGSPVEIPPITIGQPLPIPLLTEILKLLEALTVGAAFNVIMTLTGITNPIVTMLSTVATIGAWLESHPEIVTSIKILGLEIIQKITDAVKELLGLLGKVSIPGIISQGPKGIIESAGKVSNWLETSGANDWIRDFNEQHFGKNTGWKTGLKAVGSGLAIAGAGIAGTIGTGSAIITGATSSPLAITGSSSPLALAGASTPLALPAATSATTTATVIDTSLLQNILMGSLAGFADGGISNKANIVRISEGNTTEAVIPLNSPSANPAFDSIADKLADRLIGLNGSSNNMNNTYNLAPGGIVIADDYSVDRFVELVANKLATMQRDRGELSYGTR